MTGQVPETGETRRTVLKYLGAAAGAGVLGTQAVDPFAHPVAALQSGEGSYETDDIVIDSFDDTAIAATAYEPEAEGPHPAILMTHGWGGSRADLQPLADAYATREFFVLAYDSRGFGESGGEVNSTSEIEQQDASALIDWLADQDAVLNDDENDPRIGMDGVSYGGGIQLRTAAADERLDAIVPRATWNSLAQSLAPNDVIKQGWITALELGAEADPAGNISEAVDETTDGILERGRMTEEDREFYRQRSPVSYDEITGTPALVIIELTDQLFPINEGIRNFRKLQQDGSETTLLLGQDGTHILGHTEEFPPGAEASQAFAGQVAIQWLTAHLKGDGDPEVSTLQYYDEDADEFRTAPEFPPYPERSVTRTLPREVELDGETGNVATVDIPIREETEIIGAPQLEVDATPTGDGQSHLFVALRKISDGGVETIKEQVTATAVDEAGEIDLELIGVQANFEPGDVLQVAMSAREDDLSSTDVDPLFTGSIYRPSDDDAGIEIDAGQIELTLPASEELPEEGTVPTPIVESLADADGSPQTAAVHDLESAGYVEEEFVISGTARPTTEDADLFGEGVPDVSELDPTGYATRALVYRPEDPDDFSGDVLIDWMNVTQQRDAPVTWINAHEYLMREGYAVVLLSAQEVGVQDSDLDRDLVSWNPDRYSDLNHPGDSYAYDIFSQTAQAARDDSGLLGGLAPEVVIGTGMSQSAFFLQSYIADVQPEHNVFDGFLPAAFNIVEPGVPASETPTLSLNTEDEAPERTELAQDGDNFRLWEVAGASHINIYLSAWVDTMEVRDFDDQPQLSPDGEWNPGFAGQWGQMEAAPYGACGTNYFPVRYAYRSGLEQLRQWIRNGEPAPSSELIELDGDELVTDEFDNTQGGLRLPQIDEPIASYYAHDEVCQPTEENPLAYLQGATERFEDDTLLTRYGDKEGYLAALEAAADDAVERGVLLPSDREDLLARAEALDFPTTDEQGADDESDADETSTDGTDDTGGDDGTDEPGDDEQTDGTDDADDDGPGFGVPAALGGAGGLAYLLGKRVRSDGSYCRTENLERISTPGGSNIFTNFCPAVSVESATEADD